MIGKCNKCGECYEATGLYVIEVLSGGRPCPNCDGMVDIVIAKKKGGRS